MMIRFPPLLLPALLVAGCGLSGGQFPSLAPRPAETPRVIAAETPAALSGEERAGLKADLGREQQALAATAAEVATARKALTSALAAPGATTGGSEAWSRAQMTLSRFDLARAPLEAIDVRLVPLQRLVDSLAETDPDRIAVQSLAARVAAESAAAQQVVDSASRRLG